MFGFTLNKEKMQEKLIEIKPQSSFPQVKIEKML